MLLLQGAAWYTSPFSFRFAEGIDKREGKTGDSERPDRKYVVMRRVRSGLAVYSASAGWRTLLASRLSEEEHWQRAKRAHRLVRTQLEA